MGVTYRWHNPSVILITVEAPWEWDEYIRVVKQLFDEAKQVNGLVATIDDITRMGPLPSGSALSYLERINKITPENIDASVILGAPYIARTLMSIFLRLSPQAARITFFANSVDEAVTLIEGRRTKTGR
jgi:hypothetical protein